VQLFSKEKRGRRRDSSTVPKVDDTAKSDAVAGEAEDGGWRLEVEDDQRKLGQWIELLTRLTKKYDWEYKMGQKDRRRNTSKPKRKRKRKKKQGMIFWLLKIEILIQMIFDLKFL
jgi:subtilisin-like proprotein convertase family protein